jgi:hypothetical protein
MPHETSNLSFNSGIHGPNQTAGSFYGTASNEVTGSDVYESFVYN